ncbi:MAG: HAD family phosphatase [Anaerolineales bacterium]
MIRAMIFDLDGTLVQTERLKALSYASAMTELCSYEVDETEIIEVFKEVVGLSRREVATYLLKRFEAESAASQHMDEFGVSTPWQAYVQMRMRYYEDMLADPDVLRNNQWPHNMTLLEEARRAQCKVGLATMSHCPQVQRVLQVLNLSEAFNFIASRDDVENGKPDPEIYLLVSKELEVPPEECLVIEDSPTGVRAALAAGMWCIAVTTSFTRQSMHIQQILDKKWVVDDPTALPAVVNHMITEHQEDQSTIQ